MRIKIIIIGMVLAYFMAAKPLFAVYYVVTCPDEIKAKELALKELERCTDQINKDTAMPCAMEFQTLLWASQQLNYCRYNAGLHQDKR
jgi:hypothetical protein